MLQFESMLSQDYNKYLQMETDLLAELELLPRGTVCKKYSNGKMYYSYQISKNRKRYTKAITENEAVSIDNLKERRWEVKQELKMIRKYIVVIKKAFKNDMFFEGEYNPYKNVDSCGSGYSKRKTHENSCKYE